MSGGFNIYFCGSIRAGRQDADLYARIIKKLEAYGEVLTPFVADKSLDETGLTEGGLTGDRAIHDRDVRLLKESDRVVAECTIPSHGVGYEIGRAVAMEKPILCLHRPSGEKRAYTCKCDQSKRISSPHESMEILMPLSCS